MTRLQRRTPCVGICSTTYGDLVCRGCKRFAHEIVGWNHYSDAQRQDVQTRLKLLKAGVVPQFLQVTDRSACEQALGVELQAGDDLSLVAYEFLTRARAGNSSTPWKPSLPVRLAPGIDSAAALRSAVEAEFLARSKAVYERNFKVTVD